MTAQAISNVLAKIRDQSIREKQYDDSEAVRYWLERLDDNAREIVREYFGEALLQPKHPFWSEAMQALGWFGWPDPERNVKYLTSALHLYREGSYEYEDFLIALMHQRHRPAVELFSRQFGKCDHRDCRCHVLAAHLAYVDSSASVACGAELLSRPPEGARFLGDYRVGVFFTVYGHWDPSLLTQLVDAVMVRNPEKGRFIAKTFGDSLDWFGTWGTDEVRKPLRSWMLNKASGETS